MTLYTAHLPDHAAAGETRLMHAVFVKDGFHWLALVFPVFWLLFNRVWWGLLAYFGAVFVLALVGRAAGMPDAAVVAADVLIGLFLGVVAHDVKGWQLRRRGYSRVEVVTGRDLMEAERRFFDRALGEAARRRAAGPPPAPPPVARQASHVLGLFPEAEGAR